MAKTITPTRSTTEAWVFLNLAHREVTRRFEAEMRRAGLPSPSWYDVLWALERAPDGLRQYELQKHCLYDQPNLSRTLKRMADEGLVLVERPPDDGRGRVLRLTETGKTLRARMWEVYGGLMIELIEKRMPPERAADMVAGLRLLVSGEQILLQ